MYTSLCVQVLAARSFGQESFQLLPSTCGLIIAPIWVPESTSLHVLPRLARGTEQGVRVCTSPGLHFWVETTAATL